jgi:hypothetical protein
MRQIDLKYKTSGNITKLDGTPVPDDEPLMLFRGRDKLLPQLLERYEELCRNNGSPPGQLEKLHKQVNKITSWQSAHPDRLKIPD